MNSLFAENISKQTGLDISAVKKTLHLFNNGSSIPFIARYRKEQTGGLDEVELESIKETFENITKLQKRKETIFAAIEKRGELTEELKKRIEECYNPTELEDIYLPYKTTRQTRAVIAKKRGLEPLAFHLIKQYQESPLSYVKKFLNDEVTSVEEALAGARDIIAEWISENEKVRNIVRSAFKHNGYINSKSIKLKEEEGSKYRDYFNWSEPLKSCPPHRLLAMRRGEKEGFLTVSIRPKNIDIIDKILKIFIKNSSIAAQQVKLAITDSYKRLIEPSIENEFTKESKSMADKEAINVFANNLRQLLFAPPLGPKRVLAIDPGYRSGCKIVCLDEQGNLLYNDTIYPHKPREERKLASKKISSLVEMYKIDAIAIGNGTAGRETEHFIKKVRFNRDIRVYVVNEDGASVYSASSAAREEFPQYDVTVRGAVSIGRRLIDPLAELVKIDPKSIGVGQYQHDVDQKELKKSLNRTVEWSVNLVGVNVNTSGTHLLSYVSGLGPKLAKNIIDYRKKNGPFQSREELKSVPGMGEKSFEQSAGFLRIPDGTTILDNTAVHPESYHIVESMASDLHCSVNDLIQNKSLIESLDMQLYQSKISGLETLNDIKEELMKPGRDPRKSIEVFEFDKNIYSIDDLEVGMIIPGIVNNITKFGAFVDIGVKQSGLVHISEMADRFISDPGEVVSIHQHVMVRVKELDIARNRIQLSMKGVNQ